MSLKDFFGLVDDKLHEAFKRKAPKAPDFTKVRAKVVKSLDKALEQFKATEPTKGRKLFKINNDTVELTLPFSANGKSVFYIPSERFADAIAKLKAAVNGGELDKEIVAGKVESAPKAAPKVRGKRGPLSPEKLAERRAKMAAKKK